MIRSMPIWAAAVAAFLASAACSNDVVPRAEKLAERACACDDAECAQEVNTELETFLQEATGGKLSERDRERLRAAASQIGECIAEHVGAETADEGASNDRDHARDD